MGVVLSQHGPNVDGFVFWWIIGFTLFSLMSRLNDNEGYSDHDVRFPLLIFKDTDHPTPGRSRVGVLDRTSCQE